MTQPDSLSAKHEDTSDATVDALLGLGEAGSIVDRLLALPGDDAEADVDAWTAAVSNRLQSQLAERMREVLRTEAPDDSEAA